MQYLYSSMLWMGNMSHPFQKHCIFPQPQYQEVSGTNVPKCCVQTMERQRERLGQRCERNQPGSSCCTNRSLHLHPLTLEACWGLTNLLPLTLTFMKPYTTSSQLPSLFQKSRSITHLYSFTCNTQHATNLEKRYIE